PLLEWWANLLVSGATGQSIRPFLVDLMAKMGSEEAALLEQLWIPFAGWAEGRISATAEQYISGFANGCVDANATLALKENLGEARYLPVGETIKRALSEKGMCVKVSVPFKDGRRYFLSDGMNKGPALDVCRSLNLLRSY